VFEFFTGGKFTGEKRKNINGTWEIHGGIIYCPAIANNSIAVGIAALSDLSRLFVQQVVGGHPEEVVHHIELVLVDVAVQFVTTP